MRILVNMSTLKKGGGQNVGLNFIHCISKVKYSDKVFFYAVVQDSEIHKALLALNEKNIVLMPANPLKKLWRELTQGRSIVKENSIDIIYSYFGYGLYPKSCLQVSGSADSNLFFPEIDFWKHYSGLQLMAKKAIDSFRIWGVKRATAVIFENAAMQKRGVELFGLKNTTFIKPSFSLVESDAQWNLPYAAKNKKVGLFFCGWQLNKNYELIPHLAAELKQRKIDFHFVITAPADNSVEHEAFVQSLRSLNVESMVSIVGAIKKAEIPSLYRQIHFVFLLSNLESFSNNIIEAWQFAKPLMIANAEWSKAICNDGACYVERVDKTSIASALQALIENEASYSALVQKGRTQLSAYPSIEERTQQEVEYIEKIYHENR
jgi:glycosyltransferase involved in cell wall biosynthesis